MSIDVAIIGAGAAGLASAIFTARHGARGRVVALDGARRPGAKILVSGGGRCNVTNTVVTERDFRGGNPNLVRQVLRAFPASETVDFFREIGVTLHEEEHGKLFPDSNRAQTVLGALLAEVEKRGVELRSAVRVGSVERGPEGFRIETSAGAFAARRVVLATGGLSLPKTGSDGAGYGMAEQLGHTIVTPTPALVPLCLSGEWYRKLSGVAHDVTVDIEIEGQPLVRVKGALLWTHFGASGPVVLDASRFWHRAQVERRAAALFVNMAGGRPFEQVEQMLLDAAAEGGRQTLRSVLAHFVPAAVGEALALACGFGPTTLVHTLPRGDRRRLVHALVRHPLAISGTRGYNFAEVTAGGVELAEINAGRMESRRCPGLHLVGEIVDVDGRLGGFNFQWAWSTGFVAGRALARET